MISGRPAGHLPSHLMAAAIRRSLGVVARVSQLAESSDRMPQGTVKILVVDRGYGFVARADGEDVFFHHSSLPGRAFKTLTVGQTVEFELAGGNSRSAKGPRAKQVTVTEMPPA